MRSVRTAVRVYGKFESLNLSNNNCSLKNLSFSIASKGQHQSQNFLTQVKFVKHNLLEPTATRVDRETRKQTDRQTQKDRQI